MTTSRKTSVLRGRTVNATTLPVRAPTVRGVMTNSDIGNHMDGLFKKGSLDIVEPSKAGAETATPGTVEVVDAETQRLTEFAYF